MKQKTAIFACIVFLNFKTHAASMLGVSTYAATKIVDAIMAGMSLWTIVSLVITGAAAAAIAIASVKHLVKKFGRRVAISW